MSDYRNDFIPPCAPCDDVRAESIVVEAYLQLPLLPRQVDGSWAAPLKRCRRFEFRLVERAARTPAGPVLRVELLDLQTHTAIEPRLPGGRGCRRGVSGDDPSCQSLRITEGAAR